MTCLHDDLELRPVWCLEIPKSLQVDFACLGLRPHLMLKLVRKPPPPTDGPHAFSELFSTVVVENNEAGNGMFFLMDQLLLYFVNWFLALTHENYWEFVVVCAILNCSESFRSLVSDHFLNLEELAFSTHHTKVYLLLEVCFWTLRIFVDLLFRPFPGWPLRSLLDERRCLYISHRVFVSCPVMSWGNFPLEDMEELGEEEDGGLPAHLEVDPQEKFFVSKIASLIISYLSSIHVEIRWFLIRHHRDDQSLCECIFVSLPVCQELFLGPDDKVPGNWYCQHWEWASP